MENKKIILLGSGFAAYSCLKHLSTKKYSITLISPRNHFLFTPLLPSTTVGTIQFRSIIEPIRVAKKNMDYYQAECVGLDTINNRIYCENVLDHHSFSLEYDFLVIAVGCRNNTYGIPGVAEHALFLKELQDARAIRQGIIDCFERASTPHLSPDEKKKLLHFVVIGGGPTGVEFSAEMHDFVTEDLVKWYPDVISFVSLTLLEAMPLILGSFDHRLAQYTLKIFKRQNIQVKTASPVKKIDKDIITLQSGEEMPYGLVVWAAGLAPLPFVEKLPFEKNKAGRILTGENLLVPGTSNVYAVGDCASVGESGYPATAQVAEQQGKHLAKGFNKIKSGSPSMPFNYKHMGMLAYIGSHKALADLPGLKGHGFVTWIFWRSAYITRLVSLKNKILVLFDWFIKLVFGRDISRF